MDKELQTEVARWAEKALPPGANHLNKAKAIMDDLLAAPSSTKEMAGLAIALILHAESNGVDLAKEVRERLLAIQDRRYGPADAQGICRPL